MAAQQVRKIDRLPPVQRDAVIKAILEGVSLRKIGAMAGCSEAAVMDYRDKIVLPSLGRPLPVKSPVCSQNDSLYLNEDKSLQHDIAVVSLGRTASTVERLASDMMRRSTKMMDRVQQAKDLDARGWSAVANVGVKTIQLLGQLSGELDAGRKSDGITIQVLLPSATRSAQLEVPDTAIDITPR